MTRLQEYILVIGFSVLYDGEVHPVIVFFFNEGWFSLCGEVNSKNGRYWSAENPGLVH